MQNWPKKYLKMQFFSFDFLFFYFNMSKTGTESIIITWMTFKTKFYYPFISINIKQFVWQVLISPEFRQLICYFGCVLLSKFKVPSSEPMSWCFRLSLSRENALAIAHNTGNILKWYIVKIPRFFNFRFWRDI